MSKSVPMLPWADGFDGGPAKIKPIVKPGASWPAHAAARALVLTSDRGAPGVPAAAAGATAGLAAVTLLMIPVAVAGGLSLAGFWLATVAVVAAAGAGLAATWRATSAGIVAAPGYSFDGVRIERDALELLADIQERFEAARATLARVPAAIGWDDVRDDVDVLMWEAAEHAAKLSAIEIELIPLAFAERRTEKSALRRRLFRVRKEHYDHLLGIRHEADALAREAANAVAAAKIALSRTGIVFDVPLVMPTQGGLAARGTLIAARTRLSMLAEAWSELDETGAMARDGRKAFPLEALPTD